MSKFYSGTIKKGSQGSDVSEWQNFLNTQGYNLSVDGIFGDNTYNATLDWQGKNGLSADGIVGQNTWGKAGYSNLYTPVGSPTISPSPTSPTFNTTSFDDTDEGKAASSAKTNAENAVNNYGDFAWDKQGAADEVWNKIFNRPDFTYDFNADALYQQYKDKYIQQGKLAMADTMGQAAAMTGGYGNSYAATAGNQAYQAHLQNLNDIIPELYQMAYDKYKQEGQDLYNQYGLLMDDHDREYGMWTDEYNRLISDRTYAGDNYYNEASLYGTEQDRVNNALQQGYTNEFAAWEAENENAWAQAEWDESMRRYLLTPVTSSSSSGGGSGSSKDEDEDEEEGSYTTTGAYNPPGKDYFDHDEEKQAENAKANGGSYYQQVLADLRALKTIGAKNDEVSKFLNEMVGNNYITRSEYMSLYNKYRDDRLG